VISWRVPAAALVVALCLSVIGYAVFPRAPHAQNGTAIRLPDRTPSNAAWVWPDGMPGWTPGQTIKGFPVAGLQPIEVQASQLAAAHRVLDAEDLRVVVSLRGDDSGPLAILATHTLFAQPASTCLAAQLTGAAPVEWLCPGDRSGFGDDHVLIAAKHFDSGFDFAGVARGDVTKIVEGTHAIYVRGKTWGEFEATSATTPDAPLDVYVGKRLVETVPLDLGVGQQRVLR
jgi:hypothetical protein